MRPLADIAAGLVDAPRDVRVGDVTLDSRAVSEGALFLACRGTARHGIEFAQQAIDRGARAILYESDAGDDARVDDGASADAGAAADDEASLLDIGLPASVREAAAAGRVFVAPVPRLSQQAGLIADRFFEAPSRLLTVTGVTGTNGKTTCAYLTAQALSRLGRRTGYLGTLGCGLPGAITALDLTTPDAVTVHRRLAELRALGAACVAMEVSSHALAQGRVNGVRFRSAAFTNLTRDHLDFHGSMQAYGAAKARLFERELDARIINIDDAFGRELAGRVQGATGRLIVTSRDGASGHHAPGAGCEAAAAQPDDARAEWLAGRHGADWLRARDVRLGPAGVSFAIESTWGAARLSSPLIGAFNVDNLLTVLGVLLALGEPLDRAITALAQCTAAPGRMEIIRGRPGDPVAIVDYAHTPDGLAKALQAARAHCSGTLRVVFGCGGDRDRGKRALMGRTARELADEIIVTDDNPRTEDPRRIVADIIAGIEGPSPGGAGDPAAAGATVRVQHDRAAAIRDALACSAAGDVVVVAGKGHEDYQIVGRERRSFSDQAVVRAFFALPEGRA